MSKPAGMKRYDLIVTKSYEHPDGTWVRADDPAILAAIEAMERRRAPNNMTNEPAAPPSEGPYRNGAELIAQERARQVNSEGWTQFHDEMHHRDELALAAACYALPKRRRRFVEIVIPGGTRSPNTTAKVPSLWPWDAEWWKPTDDRIRELTKAGALIAAEIDRLQRLGSKENS